MNAVRCFAGIPLTKECTRLSLAAAGAISARDRTWREEKWVAENNIHVTLKFLGMVDEMELPSISSGIAEAVAQLPAFPLPVDSVRAVPGTKRCRMLWVTFLDPDGKCASLASAIEQAVVPFGIPLEDRPFRPHATLCRARRPKPLDPRALEDAQILVRAVRDAMSVSSATLFTSRLTPGGPIYEMYETFPLVGV